MTLQSARKTTRGRGIDVALVLVLFVLSLGVRWLYARAVTFPHADGAAFYLTSAENLASGRGLVDDVLWSYQTPFPAVTHPSHERRMPLTTAAIAAAVSIQRALTGASEPPPGTAQMPGLLFGALLAPLTYLLGRRMLPELSGNRWSSLGAALLIVINPTLAYQSATVDGSAPFALFAAWALAVAVRRSGEGGGYLGAGLLVALAYLTRSSGLLLLVAIPLAWWLLPMPARPPVEIPDTPAGRLAWEAWPRQKASKEDKPRATGPGLRHLIDLMVAFSVIAVPWLVRNYLSFGTPLPRSVIDQAWLTNYIDNFNYLSHPTVATWLAQPWSLLVDQRLQALAYSGQILLVGTFPWGVLALPGIWLLRRELPLVPSFLYGLLLVFGVALVFPVALLSGAFYHSFGALMPFLALAAMYAVHQGAQLLRRRGRMTAVVLASVVAAVLVLDGWLVVQTLPAVSGHHVADREQFEATADWLSQHAVPDAVFMTNETYTLNYASGHPCIALPGNESPDAAWQAAERYDASYLVVTEQFGLYPEILAAQPDPRFRLVAEIQGSRIYAIGRDEP